jgi:peroxiredoxin
MLAVLGCQREAPEEKPKLPSRKTIKKTEIQPQDEESTPEKGPSEPARKGRTEAKRAQPTPSEEKKTVYTVEPEGKTTEEPAAPSPSLPKVALSEADQAASLVKVGDKLPDAELPDPAGKAQSLRSLFGQKLTVVVFWSGAGLSSLQELQDLGRDVAGPYAKEGVQVVGINERDAPEEVKAKLEQTGAKFPVLLDRDGSLLAKVTTDKEKLPRTYLLDSAGKVLWFDVVYSSHGTRDDLLQAIGALLGK